MNSARSFREFLVTSKNQCRDAGREILSTTRVATGLPAPYKWPHAENPISTQQYCWYGPTTTEPSSSATGNEFAFIVSLEINIYDSNLCVHYFKFRIFIIVLTWRAFGLLLLCFWDKSEYPQVSAYFLKVRLIF